MKMGRIPCLFAYMLYAVLVAGVCLWVYFPYTAYVNAHIAEQEGTSFRVSVTQAEPLLPLGLEAQALHLAWLKGAYIPPVKVEDVQCRVAPLSLFRQTWDASVRGRLFGGKVEVAGTMAPMKKPRQYDGRLVLEGMRLEDILAWVEQLERVSGSLSGDLVFQGSLASPLQGTGNATLALEGVGFGMEMPLSGSVAVAEGKGSLAVRLEKGRVEILACDFACKGMKGTASGSITLRQPLGTSTLDLQLAVTPDAAVTQQFPAAALVMQPNTTYNVHLNGMMNRPRIRFTG